ncbi:hypothetical protein Ddye_002576 [Dipteronia dyeriana]|uniref:ABC transporter domain-containing protein n=1 Tax=Dipteronia dyeriana TaxID=168575 RepID=A0AAE0CUI7_9ROSI|nr:hypothetical protein Ddye_002576 [Dipteronia dyeriana]
MAASLGPATFWTQADALLRKNLTFQKRNVSTNVRLILFPVILCILFVILQNIIDTAMDSDINTCGCTCIKKANNGDCEEEKCGFEYSTLSQASSCPIPKPPSWAPLLQIPYAEFRSAKTDSNTFPDLPDASCRSEGTCPVTVLFTGTNESLGNALAQNMFPETLRIDKDDIMGSLATNVIGTDELTSTVNFIDPAVASPSPLYSVQSQCTKNPVTPIQLKVAPVAMKKVILCFEGLSLWRNSSAEINDEIYKGYQYGNSKGEINEILAAYDFRNSDMKHFNVNVWYNSSYTEDNGRSAISLSRVPRSLNLASNAYLQYMKPGAQIPFEFTKEMPKGETKISIDLSSILGTLFFTWVTLQLFPVILTALVYEKQQQLRIMMKMHGLRDGPYWLISYLYFLTISVIYMLCFVIFGTAVGLKYFTLNDYGIQFLFFFIYVNLQIAMAFLVAAIFSDTKTAAVIGYIMVFGSGLLGNFLFQLFVQNPSFPRIWVMVLELYPGFALYRGLYEFRQYATKASFLGIEGMKWADLSESGNGMLEVLIIMFFEWWVLLIVAYYIDQMVSSGGAKGPLFFLQKSQANPPSFQTAIISMKRNGSEVFVEIEKPDVREERKKVEQLVCEPSDSHSIICHNLRKLYPARDGNPEKVAVKGFNLALSPGECFGMLGPNGAGKTTFISMMIGLINSTSGTAIVQGLNMATDMDKIYTSMGVCAQYDLLWETLTGREHLLFYGRLKNLKGEALTQAVEESLKSINLFHGGVADKQAGKYSGGMKRRLSVSISLIGDPKVVYMDEPSTGLDPASRNTLWKAVKQAKQDRAIVLTNTLSLSLSLPAAPTPPTSLNTSHSMEEAEALCDRLGIFVDGSLECIGNPRELKARYGGLYVFQMTTTTDHEDEVESMVKGFSRNATKIYQISGTIKFEIPKGDVRIADVFQAIENAKSKFAVYAWGLADTDLEDVFIKVARRAQGVDHVLS